MTQSSQRIAQRERTRRAIVAAAVGLDEPTVEQAADAAGVSRATAYRYFPTQESLAVEIEREAFWQPVDALVKRTASLEVEERLDRLIDAIVARVAGDERHVRQALRVYHDTWLRNPGVPVRQGGRMAWIDAVIAPFPPSVRERLRLPLALAVGPDQVTILKDVARLPPDEIARVLKWSAAALVRAAVTGWRGASPASSGTRGLASR